MTRFFAIRKSAREVNCQGNLVPAAWYVSAKQPWLVRAFYVQPMDAERSNGASPRNGWAFGTSGSLRKSIGDMRSSLVASWYWIKALSTTKARPGIGLRSSCSAESSTGPSHPSGAVCQNLLDSAALWLSTVRRQRSRRAAPYSSSQYGPRSPAFGIAAGNGCAPRPAKTHQPAM